MKQVSIIDYGIGNILSVKRAFENQNIDVKYVYTAEEILNAEYLVLPGVGAFKDGMRQLENRNITMAIRKYCEDNRPFLGICLGMQMMLDESEEFGITRGLGIIPGKVVRIEPMDLEGRYQKIPQVGWNKLIYRSRTTATILEEIPEKTEVYFVHSYMAIPYEDDVRLADTSYGGHLISAVIQKGNCYGTQFHPEKSGKVGLKIIRNFLRI
jgi:glutamine amidotransferase